MPFRFTALLALAASPLRGQYPQEPPMISHFSAFTANALIGGATAATTALLRHHNPAKAFAIGALGGGVHYAGKYVASRHGTLSGWTGLAIAATGTSMVTNAGAAMAPLSELAFPVASLRLRVTPAQRRVRLGVNLYESFEIVRQGTREHLQVDWGRSVQSGALVMNAVGRHIVLDGEAVGGVQMGSVAVIGPFAGSTVSIWKHETTHVHQSWFMQDAWGVPIETAVRRRMPVVRRVPEWLELGVVAIGIDAWSQQLWGEHSGVFNLMQREAELLERP